MSIVIVDYFVSWKWGHWKYSYHFMTWIAGYGNFECCDWGAWMEFFLPWYCYCYTLLHLLIYFSVFYELESRNDIAIMGMIGIFQTRGESRNPSSSPHYWSFLGLTNDEEEVGGEQRLDSSSFAVWYSLFRFGLVKISIINPLLFSIVVIIPSAATMRWSYLHSKSHASFLCPDIFFSSKFLWESSKHARRRREEREWWW